MHSRSYHIALLAAGLLTAACGSEPVIETIDRQDFIHTYADLRIAAVRTDSSRVAAAARDSILTAHGVTEADLMTFAEVHAGDLDFMRDVWNEVELLMDREDDGSD